MNIFTLLFTQPLANGLILFYNILGQNLGLAIIGFSLALRFALSPLTKPYMDSMKRIKQYQPELEKIKRRHKGDRKKAMEAQAEFYKQKGINPSSGCIPYLLQIVILIALFNLFRHVLIDGNVVGMFNELLYPPLRLAEGSSINTQFLFLDITKPDVFRIEGLPFPIPGVIVILAAALQFLSAKIAMPYVEQERKVAKATETPVDDFQTSMQSSMIYTFPLMTLFIGVGFPSGLALYWLMFSLFQAVQQYRSSGLGGLTPWARKLGITGKSTNGLLQLPDSDGKKANKKGRSSRARS
ncbi:hypothetical protein A2801_01725 [Candidatus Woesebacteria bacterium RIFCSPHIGHO2_01_FULL_41_10]|uniref:Membrane insertase YidC/Oxa/ALB C-terminal domain-containing protein n=1 Tax=Candidatus Woesebacteria bacterium RIFCSPHIGHO2_01_FULL_41_10 TaxID=1802500 RepID=A0A1F7YMN1_9BACT|nr:MAG: hypothetical protein A2801_01725 [Candidatus Woesebacteria bacterium RIFCSPHIGHO2_01_FULL_41_10]